MAALSLATDLGMGQPLEQALRTCLIAIELAQRLGLTGEAVSEVFYVALLRFLGCTADAFEFARLVGGDDIAVRQAIAPVLGGTQQEWARQVMPKIGAGLNPLRRAQLVLGMMANGQAQGREGVRAHCEMGEHLATRLGLQAGVQRGLLDAFETWNGRGFPKGASRDAIQLSARIVFVARDAEVMHRHGGLESVRMVLRARGGETYDPAVATTLLESAAEVMEAVETESVWGAVLEREPEPRPWIPVGRFDSVLETFADFVDLKSPSMAGHSRGVAELVASGGNALRRTALVHDLGRMSVPNAIWDKPGRLTQGEWERVRLHPYYTERILDRSATLRSMAALAGMHHERVDGSGYHRASKRAEIPSEARLLAAADAFQAMTQPRAFRQALSPGEAADRLKADARGGRLDVDAVDSVLQAAGQESDPIRRTWPAGLSEREVEVLRLLCRGGTKKQVAAMLRISASTVDHHVRHIYDKVGVATRAGATLFAVENDLLK
ncbi:MAG TPA: HD domain-containing phosphohydrolase [Candidatus Dormibacteraeota bacterium]|nr:HD domain-containing phosphohydrolase [Candidatus Dormibacteraeota bacterium]